MGFISRYNLFPDEKGTERILARLSELPVVELQSIPR